MLKTEGIWLFALSEKIQSQKYDDETRYPST